VTSPAQWSPDPTGRHEHRYWDGQRWTDQVSDAGIAAVDAMAPPPPPPVIGRTGLPGVVIALIVAAVIGIPILCIAVITLLGNNASTKVEQLGERIGDPVTTSTTERTTSVTEPNQLVVDAFVHGMLGSAPDSITEADARCVARAVIREIGQDKLVELGLSAQNGQQPELTPELQAATFKAFDQCLTPQQKADLGAS
jgi:hypothetical protein